MLSGALIAGMALGCASNANADLSVNEKAFKRFLGRGVVSMALSAGALGVLSCCTNYKEIVTPGLALGAIASSYIAVSFLDYEYMTDSGFEWDNLKEAFAVASKSSFYAKCTALMAGITGLGVYIASTVL